jgi:DNA repair protein RadC
MTQLYNTTSLPITAWAEEDRPREKLLMKGKSALSNAELIAILIGSGNRNQTAVELSKDILYSFDNQLNGLGKCSVADLMSFKGIGEAKAISIVAALELGRRRKNEELQERSQICSSQQAYRYIATVLEDLKHEEFWVVCLNKQNKVLERYQISKGGIDSTIVDTKIIFTTAIKALASSIMLFHNHPSGSIKPSQIDINITKKIIDAGNLLDVKVLDHLIIGDNTYFSFADEGML